MMSCRPAPHLVTGTLFGARKGRMQLAIQDYAMALPGDRSGKKCGSSPNNPNPNPSPCPRLPLPPSLSSPLMLLLDLAIQTSQLIVQMANGPVRIALECTSNPANPDRVITSDRTPPGAVLGRAMKSRSYGGSSHSSTLMGGRSSKLQELMVAEDRARSRQVQRRLRCCEEEEEEAEEELRPLVEEPTWIMYCNGRKVGVANGRLPAHADLQVLSVMQAVSMGAGILPAPSGASAPKDGAGLADKHGDDDDILYIRSRFERVIGSNDCEAFYMMNPDGHGGPEISILLLRI